MLNLNYVNIEYQDRIKRIQDVFCKLIDYFYLPYTSSISSDIVITFFSLGIVSYLQDNFSHIIKKCLFVLFVSANITCNIIKVFNYTHSTISGYNVSSIQHGIYSHLLIKKDHYSVILVDLVVTLL